MPQFVLKSLTLVSLQEKRAKRVNFHPQITIVKGKNDTGKSSLLKSIYRCFGAEPAVTHPKWKDARAVAVLTFTVDGAEFHALRNRTKFSFFDTDRNLIASFDSVSTGVASFFARMFGFGLRMPTRQNELVIPPPAYLLLPFYVDQDAGWKKAWSSFANLGQFANWKKDLAEYHSGIRPNEYYEAKGALDVLNEALKPLTEKRIVLSSILSNLEERLQNASFDMDIDQYREEIKELLVIAERIKLREELLRDDLVKHYSGKTVVEAQIAIAESTLSELEADIEYIATQQLEDHIDCPMCGSVFKNSFEERLAIAQDEDRCHELLSQLGEELADFDKKIDEANRQFTDAQTEAV